MSFSKTTVAGCSLGPVTSGVMDFGPVYSIRLYCKPSLGSNPKAVGYTHNLSATIALVGTSRPADQYCNVQRWLGYHLLAWWKLVNRGKVFKFAQFLYVLQWKYVVSPAIGSYNLVLWGGTKNYGNSSYCIKDLWNLPDAIGKYPILGTEIFI